MNPENTANNRAKAVLVCMCSMACPSMKDIDWPTLMERIRLEIPEKQFMALHPRLCEEDGEQMMELLCRKDTRYVIAACKDKKQKKLLAAGFQRAGVPQDDEHFTPVELSFKNTETAFQAIQAAVVGPKEESGRER